MFAPAFTRVSFQPLHIWCGSRAAWGLAAVVGRLGGRKKAEKRTNPARGGSVKGRGCSRALRVAEWGWVPLPVRFRKGRDSLRLLFVCNEVELTVGRGSGRGQGRRQSYFPRVGTAWFVKAGAEVRETWFFFLFFSP